MTDEDEVLAESLIAIYGCAVSKPVDSKVRLGGHPGEETSRLFAEALAQRRVEIEAQAKRDVENGTPIRDAFNRGKRDGAREALEKAAKIAEDYGDGKTRWQPAIAGARIVAQAIRSLIEPTPVEPEIKEPEYVECPGCSEAGGADRPIYHEPPICAEPPPVPSKAEELPLGHEFRPYDSGFDQCGQRTTPWSVCGRAQSAHRGKRGGE